MKKIVLMVIVFVVLVIVGFFKFVDSEINKHHNQYEERKAKAFEVGIDHRQRGIPANANPYNNVGERVKWLEGWSSKGEK